jgi:hypothetical protein
VLERVWGREPRVGEQVAFYVFDLLVQGSGDEEVGAVA